MALDPGDFRYDAPTADPFTDIAQYVPLLLAAVDVALDRPDVWPEGEEDSAQGYMEDLKVWITEISNSMMIPIGGIVPYVGSAAPAGWLKCDGTQYNRVDYPDLYTALDSVFHVSGDLFTIPNLSGRAPIGTSVAGTVRTLGQTGGAEYHTLTLSETPSHSHVVSAHNHSIPSHGHTTNPHNHTQESHSHALNALTNSAFGASSAVATGNNNNGALVTRNTDSKTPVINNETVTVNDATATVTGSASPGMTSQGGGGSHNNMQPFIVLNYIIRAL
jgi:microcystin-dependent protein